MKPRNKNIIMMESSDIIFKLLEIGCGTGHSLRYHGERKEIIGIYSNQKSFYTKFCCIPYFIITQSTLFYRVLCVIILLWRYNMEINKEQLKGYLEIIILNTLRVGPSYGYEIIKKIRKVSKEQFQIKEGTLYVILKRLEREDLVESFWEKEGETGGGRRRYYRIKEKGEIYLKTKKEEWEFFKKIIDLFYKE